MTKADHPDVAAEIDRRRRGADRQAIMAVVGMGAVAAFLVIHPHDLPRTVEGLTSILPWFLGLSALIVAANRWTLSQQVKALRASRFPAAAKKP